MRFKLSLISILFLFALHAGAYAFDINSLASDVQQKSTPEQWIQKGQVPNYDESYLSNPQGLEDSQRARKVMDWANQLANSQYSYTCSMIRKVEDKSLFTCQADNSIYPSMAICQANCFQTFECRQESCSTVNLCSSYQICPLGDYPCSGNSCSKAGVCTSNTITTTQYQCPITGTLYNDLTSCNNSCTQTTSCTATPYYNSVSVSGSLNAGPLQTYCAGLFDQGPALYRVEGNGDRIDFFGGNLKILGNISDTKFYAGSIYLSGFTASGVVDSSSTGTSFNKVIGSGNRLDFYTWAGGGYWFYFGSITLNGATASGSTNTTCHYDKGWEPFQQVSASANALSWGMNYQGTYYNRGSISFSGSNLSYNYICPLSGGSACDGSHNCTAPQSCTTKNTSVTNYECSLNSTNYTTQSQCTSACVNTASCNTNYQCTYDNSSGFSTAADCQAGCTFSQCPKDNALYLTGAECQNACASFQCLSDGSKYNSSYDCQSNCKEARNCAAQ